MMISEFIERTGFEPTYDEYLRIEEAYYDFDGDKDAFCKAFVANGGEQKVYQRRADYIHELESKIVDTEKAHKAEIAKLQAEIKSVREELDRELEWQPAANAGTNMEQERYEHLASSGRKMTDEEAKAFIADECGFSPDKVTIHHKASSYEVNKHRRLRVAAEYDRDPVYESTDWNYVRFDCAYYMYELVNGELQFYCC